MDGVTISVRSQRLIKDFPADRIFFAFPSRGLTYDCRTCGAQCCRGHGYRLEAKSEIDAQLELQPMVGLFFASQDDRPGSLLAHNCPPACFFLTDQGRCGVQAAKGYAAKPETCRLFPFNDIRIVGDFLVVLPHPKLCPLAVDASPEGSDLSDHARLLADMASTPIKGSPAPYKSPNGRAEKDMVIEAAMLGTSGAFRENADMASFVEVQGETFNVLAPSASRNRTTWDLSSYSSHLRLALGAWPSDSADRNQQLAEVMLAAAPSLRIRAAFDDPGAPQLVSPIDQSRLPLLLFALHKILALTIDAGMKAVTYQTVMRTYFNYQPLLCLLASADQVVVWHPQATIELGRQSVNDGLRDYLSVSRLLLPSEQRHHRRVLSQVFAECVDGGTTARFHRLNRLAMKLSGRVVPEQELHRYGSVKLKLSMQRAMLQWFDDHTLLSMMNGDRSLPQTT